MLKVSFDIGGVISKHPAIFRELCQILKDHCEVSVITDMHDKPAVLKILADNGFGMIPPERVHIADYVKYGEMCKAVILKEQKIDIVIDDFAGYLAWDSRLGEAPIRLLIQPNAFLPYWSPDWKTNEVVDFGRRISPKDLGNV
jgi:hypothetical protein